MSNNIEIAKKLRELADQYESGYPGALCFNALGNVFGNDFWTLIAFHTYPGDERTFVRMIKAVLEEVAHPWIDRAVKIEMQKLFPRE